MGTEAREIWRNPMRRYGGADIPNAMPLRKSTRSTRRYEQEVLSAHEASGLNAQQFAAQCGIKYSSFASWLAAVKRNVRSAMTTARLPFLLTEVVASPEATFAALGVHLPCGISNGASLSRVQERFRIRE
jgi:hypothetical protein